MAEKRIGDCTPGCGACCRFLSLVVHPGYYLNEDNRKWVELHDIRLVYDEETNICQAYLKIPCTALTSDGMCAILGTPERPDVCNVWPTSQGDLNILEEVLGEQPCTYGFEDED